MSMHGQLDRRPDNDVDFDELLCYLPPGHQTPSATGGWRPLILFILVDLMVSHLVAEIF